MTGPKALCALLICSVLGACSGGEAPEGRAMAGPDLAGGTCSPSALNDPRLRRPLRPGAVDPALMDRAIRVFTNERRCKAGLDPVDPLPGLADAAAAHAGDMADSGVVAPTRPADPTRTLKVRLREAGVSGYTRRGENLMRITLETPGAARFATRTAADCLFNEESGVPRALWPTYASVAKRLVATWADTEALSANMLDPAWTHAGGGVAIRDIEGTCGDVYAAQTLVLR